MGSMFNKIFKPPKPPKQTVAAPLPQAATLEQSGEAEIRKQKRKSGFEKTFLTGSLTPNTGLKTTLGG